MTEEVGKCPGCNETGTVGEACEEKACQKRGSRFIPGDYWEGAHDEDGGLVDPLIGQMIGDFLVVGRLGQGGFGTVYLALQQPLFRLRGALKLIEPPEDNRDFAEAMLEKFQGEAEVLADLTHPNIVRLLKYGIHRHRPYLVMEYVEDGVTLRDEIYMRAHNGEPLAHNEMRHIFNQILNGLEAAHGRNVIHRDIKPENIMLQPVVGNPAHVRILDFGLAKAVEKRSDTDWTLGSPTYMAPEQVNRENLGTWTDLYALGVIFFELVTGRKPFPGDSDAEIVAHKIDDDYDPLALARKLNYDEQVLNFMERALADEPQDRFQTVEEFRPAMAAAFNAMEGGAAKAGPGSANLTMLVDSSDVLEVVDKKGEAVRPSEAGPEGATVSADPEEEAGDESAETETGADGGSEGPPPVTDEMTRDDEESGGLSRILFAASLVVVSGLGVYLVMGMNGGGGGGRAAPAGDETVAAATTNADASDTETADTTDTDRGADTSDTEGDGSADGASADGDGTDADGADTGPPLPDDAFVDVSAGKYHTCGLRADGKARCWGGNYEGELGLGHTETIGDDEPANSADPLDFGQPIDQLVAAGDANASFSCALLVDGKIGCWGANAHGQLGLGHTRKLGNDIALKSLSPVGLDGLTAEIATGASQYGSHVCVRMETGDVRCWGSGKFGKLGYGHTNVIGDNERPSTTTTVDIGGKAKMLAAGKYTTCVVLENDDLRCWGWNKHGQLGLGHTDAIGDDELPSSTDPIDVGGTPVRVSAGRRHGCAVLKSGDVRCWGWNKHGQLGLGHTDAIGDDELPADVPPVELAGPATDVSAGGIHTCALLESGEVQCWGDSRFGQLGYGHEQTIGDNEVPADSGTVSLGEPVAAISAGNFHTCVALESGDIRCWGLNKFGQLGYGHTNVIGNDEPPSSVAVVPAR